MSKIETIELANAQGKAKELLEAAQKKMGMLPNMFKALANSPVALEAYFVTSTVLGQGKLSPALREQIAIYTAELNRCDYCLSAHTTIGQKSGLSMAQAQEARKGKSADVKAEAILALVGDLIKSSGHVSDENLSRARKAAVTDEELAEVVAVTSLNIFTNYFNHLANPTIDFPVIKSGSQSCSSCSSS